MRAFKMPVRAVAEKILMLAIVTLFSVGAAFAQAQATAADLTGTVVDQNEAAVSGATVTARNAGTNLSRTTTANDAGEYQLIGLPPGDYEISAEAPTFKRTVISPVTLTVGQSAGLQIKLEIGGQDVVVNVSGDSVELIETTRTSVSTTIDQVRIENLPINQRDYLGFTLTTSSVGRDNGRPIGPAPTSGLNFGGQRGRSNLVQVDGADNTDNSINAARTTVSQEAVQEFQVVTNSFAPEFGRSAGGVVNVVTKRGTNDFHGNLFGFLRDKSIQARNPFAPIKSAYTRTQAGATLGGPIVKDRMYFFFAYERRQRNETGFFTSDVLGVGAQRLDRAITIPGVGTFNNLTGQQASFVGGLLAAGNTTAAVTYLTFASSGGSTGLTGFNPLVSGGGSIPAGQVIGSRFLLTGAPVPVNTRGSNGEFIAFRPLLNLQRDFPIIDRTNFSSIRLDQSIDDRNQMSIRFGYNPSRLSGIQVESQNQSLGQNDFSRTGLQELKDTNFLTNLTSSYGNLLNEARFAFGRRKAVFRSQNGEAVAFNISGTAFIGRELFSPVDRTETRFQLADNVTYVAGDHTLKFGADFNFVNVGRALFELNFAGLFNFGATDIRPFSPAFASLPATCQNFAQTGCTPLVTPTQAYGLGLPSVYVQGFGDPISSYSNTPIAFFAQDSWRVFRNLTLNYGVRYDVELTEQKPTTGLRDPLTGITLSTADILAAEGALGVQQGFPRDKNNFAPRFGFAYDVFGNSRTVVRGAIGLFYDHPLLAAAFNSDIADSVQQQQSTLLPGSPLPTAAFNAVQIFQGTVCTAASANPICPAGFTTPGVAASAQYQFGRQRFNDQTFTGFGPVLPFSLPIAKDFQYAYATQANAAIEQQITRNTSLTLSYLFVGAHHLPHPLDVNAPRTDLLVENFRRFAGPNFPVSQISPTAAQGGITIAATAPGTTFTNAFGQTCGVVIPGIIAQCPGGRVIVPAIANFFRPNAPNYFLAASASGGLVTKAVLDSQLAGTLRTPGIFSPFGAVNAQVSDGNSNYNAGTLDLKSRLTNNIQFLVSYTFSKSIDDSSDLQTLLLPQDNRNFRAERALSLFDQRHRFVVSGVFSSPESFRSSDNMFSRFLSDFTIAPIIEISSGRPFNIITNVDTNGDQSTSTDRPSVAADGSLVLPGAFMSGNLGRNRGVTHAYASVDLRVSRAIRFGERLRLDLIAEGFNLFNRFNEASASPNFEDVNAFGERSKDGRYFSRPTASFDPRQFQFGVKLNF